jgi:hypothetical protein
MTDQTDPMLDNREDMDDIELITSYLNGQLEPERLEAIRRRLEEDADFRELAAPLLLAWSVPRHIVRKPRPAGEMERDWAEFKRRVGFDDPAPPPPPPKPKRRWRRPLLLFLLLIASYALLADRSLPTIPGGPYTVVPTVQRGWVSLDDGIEVRVSPGAQVLVDQQPRQGMKRVLLEGSARFRVLAHSPDARALRNPALIVETRAGNVTAGESDFSVLAKADTTYVVVRELGPRRALAPQLRTVTAYTSLTKDKDAGIALFDNASARLVRGREPEAISLRLP